MDIDRSNRIARDFVKQVEGCRDTPYQDQRGVLTCGVGHTGKDIHGKPLRWGQVYTQAEIDAWLKSDMEWAADAVDSLVKVPLNENQRAALIRSVSTWVEKRSGPPLYCFFSTASTTTACPRNWRSGSSFGRTASPWFPRAS